MFNWNAFPAFRVWGSHFVRVDECCHQQNLHYLADNEILRRNEQEKESRKCCEEELFLVVMQDCQKPVSRTEREEKHAETCSQQSSLRLAS